MTKGKYSYKHKIILIVVAGGLLCILSYYLAFDKTLVQLSELKSNKSKLQKVESAPSLIVKLESELNALESEYGHYSEEMNIQEILLNKISYFNSLSQSVLLTELSEPATVFEQGFEIKRHQIILQGDFLSLLKFMENLEIDNSIGQIRSAEFYKQIDLRTKREVLYLKLFIQTIIKNEATI